MKRSPAAGRLDLPRDGFRKERETKDDGRYIIFYSFDKAEGVEVSKDSNPETSRDGHEGSKGS